MDETRETPLPDRIDIPASPKPEDISPEQKRVLIGIVVGVVVLALITLIMLIFLLNAPMSTVVRIRDIFIIFLAIQSLLMGFALVILLVQLAKLINLLQNEVKPILESTNETVSTLRGTTAFLSDNLAEPVIKLNEYLAGFTQVLISLGFIRRGMKSNKKKE